MYMAKFNLHITEEFRENLAKYMKHHSISNKAEAIRKALREAVAQIQKESQKGAFEALLGAGLVGGPENKNRKFLTEDDLWS